MSNIFSVVALLVGFGLGTLMIALGVKYGILWAMCALRDEDPEGMGKRIGK